MSSQIATAVKFLQNPNVRQSPLATRKAFLKKKGEKYLISPWFMFNVMLTVLKNTIHICEKMVLNL